MSNAPDIVMQLALLTQQVQTSIAESREARLAQEKLNNDHENRLRALEVTTNKLSERFVIWQGVQAAWASLVGVLAGLYGKLP